MKPIEISKVSEYVERNIGDFHQSRLAKIRSLKLEKVLLRKNIYLFKAKNILVSHELVRNLLDAYLSSQEETLFGNFLEGLAIFINEWVYGGQKSGVPGIDLEFTLSGVRYIVDIKSGPHWGNSNQIKKMKENFRTAKIIIRGTKRSTEVIAINGCCYGQDNKPDKGEYYKYCGQQFWEFISGQENLYIDIIVPLGYKAKEKNDEFAKEYARLLNSFTVEFTNKYCVDGNIDWAKLVKLNSSKPINKKRNAQKHRSP